MLLSNTLSFIAVRSFVACGGETSLGFFLWAALPPGVLGTRLPEADGPLASVCALLSLQLFEVGPEDETVFSSCST